VERIEEKMAVTQLSRMRAETEKSPDVAEESYTLLTRYSSMLVSMDKRLN
jgi:hypothetical protein